ncbi:hypothetical protein Tco_0514606 [Tanacetum coccineum]
MTTLADKSLLSGGDNRPLMLEKHLYDSWKSRMELYMMNRPHGRMIIASVEKSITHNAALSSYDLDSYTLIVIELNSPEIASYGESIQEQKYRLLTEAVRLRYSNPMIQPESEGSTQGYPLVSVEVLRFNTTAGNPVKKILLKLNLSDHRLLKDGGEDFRYSDTVRLSRSDEVLKLKNFKKDATLKLFKNGMSMSVQKSQVHKMAKLQDGEEIMLG